MALLRPQPRSIICNIYHKKRDNCDIIEFGEVYRKKPFAFPTESWEVLDSVKDVEAKMSLVDALWSVPRDSISILHSHLLCPSSKHSSAQDRALTAGQWAQNRLCVLHRLDVFASLSSGLASALMEQSVKKSIPFSAKFAALCEAAVTQRTTKYMAKRDVTVRLNEHLLGGKSEVDGHGGQE
jgi:hypothetical protein